MPTGPRRRMWAIPTTRGSSISAMASSAATTATATTSMCAWCGRCGVVCPSVFGRRSRFGLARCIQSPWPGGIATLGTGQKRLQAHWPVPRCFQTVATATAPSMAVRPSPLTPHSSLLTPQTSLLITTPVSTVFAQLYCAAFASRKAHVRSSSSTARKFINRNAAPPSGFPHRKKA